MLQDHGSGLRVGTVPTWVLGAGGIGTRGGGVQPAWLEREGTIVKGGCWLWASNSFGVSSVGGEWGEQKASAFSPGRVASEMSPSVLGAVWVTYAPTGRTEAYYTHVSSSTAPQIKHRLKPFIVLNLKNQIHGHQDDAPGSYTWMPATSLCPLWGPRTSPGAVSAASGFEFPFPLCISRNGEKKGWRGAEP